MDMIPVKSSNVKSIGYNEADQTVTVEFHTGSVYTYRDVNAEEFDNISEPPFSSTTMRRVLAHKTFTRV